MKAADGNTVATPGTDPGADPAQTRRSPGKRSRKGKRAKGPASSAALWGLKGFKRSEIDARNLWAVRFRRHVADLLDGLPEPTPMAVMLARRAAGLALQCEAMEAELASGKLLSDPTAYTRASLALGSTLARIGNLTGRKGPNAPKSAPGPDWHARAVLDLPTTEEPKR
jgi:hypothetical protein